MEFPLIVCSVLLDRSAKCLFHVLDETGNLKHLHRNELDKACFAHDAVYSDSKDFELSQIRS